MTFFCEKCWASMNWDQVYRFRDQQLCRECWETAVEDAEEAAEQELEEANTDE